MEEVSSKDQHHITSGDNSSLWLETAERIFGKALKTDLQTDVVVVGGGMSGMSIAYNLLRNGLNVVLLEDGDIASGETGRTTAHLTNCVDDRYFAIEKIFGEEGASLTAESHTAAIKFIEETIQRENIDCDFLKVNGYLFLHESDERRTLEDELKATHRAGLDTFLLPDVPSLSKEIGPCLRFPNQAQFHPIKYLRGLYDAIVRMGGQIFTQTHVTDINKRRVQANGFQVDASHVVIATNTPINNLFTLHTKQFPYRTYVIGATIPKSAHAPALWWDTGDKDSRWTAKPYHYARLHPFNNDLNILICGGEDHKTGQADAESLPEEHRYQALEEWTRQRFPAMKDIVYRWSGQVMEPLDHVAFIGRNPGNKNIYVVTGDSGNGMTHATIAAMLITDLIQEKANKWAKLYDPSRINFKVAGDYVREVKNMAAQYIDYLSHGDLESIADLKPGEGGILASGLKKIAVFKDEDGQINTFSAVCPHLGCVLQWNGEEKSFDCPCHGSRFTGHGKVINGPASTDLKEVQISERITNN